MWRSLDIGHFNAGSHVPEGWGGPSLDRWASVLTLYKAVPISYKMTKGMKVTNTVA